MSLRAKHVEHSDAVMRITMTKVHQEILLHFLVTTTNKIDLSAHAQKSAALLTLWYLYANKTMVMQ